MVSHFIVQKKDTDAWLTDGRSDTSRNILAIESMAMSLTCSLQGMEYQLNSMKMLKMMEIFLDSPLSCAIVKSSE